jgi:hypothetical protein
MTRLVITWKSEIVPPIPIAKSYQLPGNHP